MRIWQKLTQKQTTELEETIRNSDRTGPEVRRAQAILLLDTGATPATITVMTGYSRTRAFDLRRRYGSDGIGVIEDKRRGKPKELLTKKRRDAVLAMVRTQKPRAYGYNNDYWTTSILGAVIKKKYNVLYKSKTSYYLLFRGAKFTYHKPGRVYEKRDEAAVVAWRKTTKPKVKKALADPDTVVLVEDEMVLSTETTVQKIWLPAGEYPKIETSNTRKSKSIYGFLNLRTGTEHAFKTEWQNMYITADILKKLRGVYPTQRILLLWDKAPWHKGSAAQECIRADGRIATIEFPRASPEENPQEHVWKAGRGQTTHNRFIDDIDDATDTFVHSLNTTPFHYSFLGINTPPRPVS